MHDTDQRNSHAPFVCICTLKIDKHEEGVHMIIERDLPIAMDDGIVLRADLLRPEGEGQFPVVMTMGPYAKGLRYQEGYAAQWQWLINAHPEVLDSSTGSYLTWETVDPERWVPAGYAVLRVDSRGAGRSPGYLDPWSLREIRDSSLVMGGAETQPGSNKKKGLWVFSSPPITRGRLGSPQPPHLTAMVVWEG